MKKPLLITAIAGLLLSSFVPYKSTTMEKTCIAQEKTEKIVYLFFTAEQLPNGEVSINLQEQRINDGKLKSLPEFNENNLAEGDLVISLTNATGKSMGKISVSDPLNPVLETFEGDISRKQLSLKKAEFSVRFPYSNLIKNINVDRVSSKGNKTLFSKKLRQ